MPRYSREVRGRHVGPRLGIPARIALELVRLYQSLVSPLFAGSCRFLPSCSEYAAQALTQHGLMRGGWLAASRLARCQPLGAPGYDPVPAAESSPEANA